MITQTINKQLHYLLSSVRKTGRINGWLPSSNSQSFLLKFTFAYRFSYPLSTIVSPSSPLHLDPISPNFTYNDTCYQKSVTLSLKVNLRGTISCWATGPSIYSAGLSYHFRARLIMFVIRVNLGCS